MTDVTVVCDRDPVAAGDDVMSNGWSATVPASMPLSQVVGELVVPNLADTWGLAEWVVTLVPDMLFRVAAEAEGFYPTTYHLVGDRCRADGTPLAMILREPDESTGLQKIVAMKVLGPDVPVGQIQPNSEGDVAFYVISGSGIPRREDAERNDGQVVTHFRDPLARARLQADLEERRK